MGVLETEASDLVSILDDNSKKWKANNPLHGIKLEPIINDLVAHYGWEYMGYTINIRCFTHDPSLKSSLKFLR